MLRTKSLLGILLVLVVGMATANMALAERAENVMGNWGGKFLGNDWQERTLRAQIVAESREDFRVYLYVDEKRVQIKGKTVKKKTGMRGQVDLGSALGGVHSVRAEVVGGTIKGAFAKDGASAKFELKKVFNKSPTLGKEPPAGAVVLLAGLQASQEVKQETLDREWTILPRWKLQSDGSIQIQGSSIVSNKAFGDAQYHVEFRTPFMPGDTGQGRGNSGVYILGQYEVQVLDSFTDEPRDNQCGGIYQRAVPLTNPSLPPLEWQTYDITFKTARFDANGAKTQDAVITVKHNGVVIHDNLALSDRTPGGLGGSEATKGQLLFQDHSDRVGFRNVWVKPLD